jgi:hypothetical protein
MPRVTRRSHQMLKYKFGVTCPGARSGESVPVHPGHEKLCIDVARLRRTGMHYVTHISHWMQKHKFSIICLNALFVESLWVPPEHEK